VKVLLAHNYYRSDAPSGEDVVFESEKELLRDSGHQVIEFLKHNDSLNESLAGRLAAVRESMWSATSRREILELIEEERPDVAHFHNTFPLISPSAHSACRQAGVPVVQTLHNYRMICANGLFLREGVPCEKCLNSHSMYGALHRCYRNSLPASIAASSMVSIHRALRLPLRSVDRFIALTRFAASRFQAAGIPKDQLSLKPNFLESVPLNRPVLSDRNGRAVFVGRLTEEKGVWTLLRAWEILGSAAPALDVIGDGALLPELKSFANRNQLNIRFIGRLTRSDVFRLVGESEVQIVPSHCYEGFPMVCLEAFRAATPVIASRIGGLPEIVEDGRFGLLFQAAAPEALASTVAAFFGMAGRREMGRLARASFEDKYTEKVNLQLLEGIYHSVITGCSN